jgi:hypothetical protein
MSVFIGNTGKSDKLTKAEKYSLFYDILYYKTSLAENIDVFLFKPMSYYDWDAIIEYHNDVKKRYEKL